LSKMSQVLPPALAKARKFRSSSLWQKVRAMFLRNNPLCADPFSNHFKEGGAVGGNQVHHIKGLSVRYDLRVTESNLATVCTRCHSKVEVLERQNRQTAYLFKKS